MGDFIRDAGWGIFPVLFFGIFGLVAAMRHAHGPRPDRLALVVGLAVATVLMGLLGSAVGVQTSAKGYASGNEPLFLFYIGIRESLNNVVAALLFATLHTLIATYGTHKMVRRNAERESTA